MKRCPHCGLDSFNDKVCTACGKSLEKVVEVLNRTKEVIEKEIVDVHTNFKKEVDTHKKFIEDIKTTYHSTVNAEVVRIAEYKKVCEEKIVILRNELGKV